MKLYTSTNGFLLFHLSCSQDVFSEKSFTVAYHGRESVFFLLSFLYFILLLSYIDFFFLCLRVEVTIMIPSLSTVMPTLWSSKRP